MKNDKNPLYADNGIPMKSSMSAPPAPPPPPKGMLGIYPPQAEEESEYYSDEEWNGEAWMDEADVPPASTTCIHFKAGRKDPETGRDVPVLIAVDVTEGTLHVALENGDVEEVPIPEVSRLTRSTTDATRLGLEIKDEQGGVMNDSYSFSDPETRQFMYQAMLTCNPFGAGSSSSTSCYTEKLAVYLCQIDSANEIPQGPLDIDSDADIICILVLGEGQRDSWVEKLQDTFDGTHDFNDHLYADSDDIAHCLLVFVSTELYGTLSNAQSGVANYSTGVTFWIGETTFGIYGTEGGGYEDVEIGVPSLDLIQFRHVFAIGDCITDTIPLSGSEMAKGSCGSDSCFLWRSQPDGFEGTSVKKSSGSNSLGPYAVFETAAVLPTVSQPTEGDSPYMLIIDNMRANGLPADGSPYVYVGGQFCEDRRTTAKSGTTNPVWKFDRQVGGQVQSTVEVLQVPTYVSDPKYLGAQRVMIGVLDDAELEDPLIGFAFLPLAKSLKAPDTATDFALDLFNGMEVVGSLTGRISVHSMHSESSGTAEKVIQSDGGNNRSIIQQYFRRYDLDDSGTINSSEELQQLCTNLSVRLELKFSVNDIDAKVTSAGDMTVNNWDLDQFTQWFSDEFEIQVM